MRHAIFCAGLLLLGLVTPGCRWIAGYDPASSKFPQRRDLDERFDAGRDGSRDAITDGSGDALRDLGADSLASDVGLPPSHGLCTARGWCWENPIPTSNGLYGVWGSSAQDVHVVGAKGTLLSWNGTRWTLHPQVQGFEGELYRVQGKSTSEVYAVGRGGILLYNGQVWASDWSMPGAILEAIQADSKGIYAGGGDVLIQRMPTATWSTVSKKPIKDLHALYRPPGGDLFVAQGAELYQLKGTNLVFHSRPASQVFALWENTASSLFAASLAGVLAFNKTSGQWSSVANFSGGSYYGLWGAGSSAYAVGRSQKPGATTTTASVLAFDGTSWTSEPAKGQTLQDVWGDGQGFVIAVGDRGGALLRDPSAHKWTESVPSPRPEIVCGTSNGQGFSIVGGSRGLLSRSGDRRWKTGMFQTKATVTALWGSGDAGWLGTDDGALRAFKGSTIGTKNALSGVIHAISGTSLTNVYAAGSDGKIFVYNGTSWSLHQQLGHTIADLVAFGPDDLLTASLQGLHRVSKGTTTKIHGSACTVVVAAASTVAYALCDARIYRVDQGVATEDFALLAGETLYALWAKGTEVWAAGANGLLMHRSGPKTWIRVPLGVTASFRTLFGSSASDLYAAGDAGTILHRGP